MQKIIVSTALLLLATTAIAAPVEITVMSFNIRYGSALDGENAWPKRRDLLVETVKQSDPDILGVQECLEFQAAYLQEQLRGYEHVALGREKNGGGEMTAIFYKSNALLPMRTGHVWLSEQPDLPGSVSWDSSLTRMATWIQFLHWESGTNFVMCNTHFDHRGSEARLESAKFLSGYLKANAGDLPIILTGDFNTAGGTTAPWKAFMDAGFKDAWDEAAEKVGPPSTWSGFKAPKEGSERRIDWILMHGAVQAERCETVIHHDGDRYPSDHFPVVTMVKIGAD